ncbi:MAG TPA: OmpA family protein [Stellaceae bacterium]|nr:OmpA family protein [Stellaceae bacterium]
MKIDRRVGGLLLLAGGAALTGCSGWSFDPPTPGNPVSSSMNVDKVAAATPAAPVNFDQSLTGDYARLAKGYDADNQWSDADYFSRKGLAAANGGLVPPEENSRWLIPLEVPDRFRTELGQERKRLVNALDSGGRERAPAIAANAQTNYDCWVADMQTDWSTAQNKPCKRGYMAAMNDLDRTLNPVGTTAPEVHAREFRVYFALDKSTPLANSDAILARIAEELKANPNAHIALVGKADRLGTDSYNMALSRRRAEDIERALNREGVPEGRIDATWVGEREPPVPTRDGVPDPRNRVVEITVE